MTTLAHWNPNQETYQDFRARTAREKLDAAQKRRLNAILRLALTSLDWTRYAIGVEHGKETETGPWRVHAYVVCKDCYRTKAGIVDPRTTVASSEIRGQFPDNEVLAVGAEMSDVVRSMISHEQVHHQGPNRVRA